MQAALIRTLSARRAQIRARWEAFLRIERVNTPLANPDTLVYLFDDTLKEVFAMLQEPPARRSPGPLEPASGNNPLIAYFIAGEQALLEALILAQAGSPSLDPAVRDTELAELKSAIRTIARRELGTWDGLCQPKKAG